MVRAVQAAAWSVLSNALELTIEKLEFESPWRSVASIPPESRQSDVHGDGQRSQRGRLGATFGSGAVEVRRHRQQVGDGFLTFDLKWVTERFAGEQGKAVGRVECGAAIGLQRGVDDLAQFAQMLRPAVDLDQAPGRLRTRANSG